MDLSVGLIALVAILVIVLLFLFAAVKVAREYERGVIFRLGRLLPDPKGPGLFLLIPVIDRMVKVDLRTVTLNVPPQEVITKDNVPVRVNAVAYFRIVDANAAIVQVENYMVATSQIAQTTLRSVLGQHVLDELLSERDKINAILQEIIDDATSPWGIKVSVVEVKDVEIPSDMQRAMARQAEAERERRAKVISAEGEFQASERLKDAAAVMAAGADHGAAALPADAARDRLGEQLDDRFPDPDRHPDCAREQGAQRRQRRRRPTVAARLAATASTLDGGFAYTTGLLSSSSTFAHRPSRYAIATAWARVRASSRRSTRETWLLIVSSVTQSAAAISRVERPSAINDSTSSSRRESLTPGVHSVLGWLFVLVSSVTGIALLLVVW